MEQLKGDVEKSEVEVERAEDKVRLAQRELDQLTMFAPLPGLVVYLEIWKGGTRGKVQEGDSPWPGQGLVNIPDLSEMIVKTTVSEVDANKVDTGQEVIVKLDALPDKEYHGQVISKSTLARKKDYSSKINVFDVEVLISDNDDHLKPGMSASCEIVVERVPDVVSVPLEAVFEREGETVVYLSNKKKREVDVGRRNDMSIEIVDGLDGGEEICLVDPTLDEQGLPGDKATEPEINKSSPGGSGKGRGSGRRGQ
ncbi:efflux RND transporter periplasmic adaptor subunit [candidate division GN15 bacterium]|nr:efflux RND transporter periplasmic adaptor subunit [candidate division GN15 bacterium]